MTKLSKQSIRCNCGDYSYNLVTTGDPLQACISFKGRKCPLGTSVSVEVLESETGIDRLAQARSDSKTLYDSTPIDAEARTLTGGYCVCRCGGVAGGGESFKVYGCRQPGQTGPVCDTCCAKACGETGGPGGIQGAGYETTSDSIDVKNSTFVGATTLESGPDYIVRAMPDKSLRIDSNKISTITRVLGERLSKTDEEVFKALSRSFLKLNDTIDFRISGDSYSSGGAEMRNVEGEDPQKPGGCKGCGGGGGAMRRCVNGLGTTICIKIEPDIDINWGWPPSGNLNGGTITITINF
jgi:hypothetical protein